MGKLEVAVLGVPEVRHEKRIVRFSVVRALALLLYIIIEGGRQPLKKLSELFWPGLHWEAGRAMIQKALALLSQEIQEDLVSSPTPHIVVTHDALECNFSSALSLDLFTVQRALRALYASSADADASYNGSEQVSEELLLQALACYRGAFLQGFYLDHAPHFAEWVTQQRGVWHNAMGVLFARLSQMQEASGQIEKAIETATRWIGRDPLNEAAYRRLMQLYFACGNAQAALLTYRQCRVILAERLNTRPAAETAWFAERIDTAGYRHNAITAHRRAGRAITVRPSLAAVFRSAPFVGRSAKLDRLLEIYRSVQNGRTEIVTVKGEAGIGKTRLITEFLERATALGADVLSGRAFENGGSSPYLPLIEMFELRGQRGESDKASLNDTLRRMLAEMHSYTLQQSHEKTAHKRLLEAFTLLGQALARQAPVVLFVDDIQWADAASLDMLGYACRRWTESGTPLLVILTARTEALVTIPGFAAWLSLLERTQHVSGFILNAFSQEETLQVVRSIAAIEEGSPSPDTRLESCGRWLYSETRGQPFYVTEALKTLYERAFLSARPRGDGTWALDFAALIHEKQQPSLAARGVVSGRITQVSSTTFALLAAAAVLGRSFLFTHVCRIAGLNEHEGREALDEVLKKDLWYAVGDCYVFMHDKIREAVYAEIAAAERSTLHSRALEVLRSEAAPVGLLAYHAQEAGLYEQAFSYFIAAGDEAQRLFALRDASTYYESARQLLMGQQASVVLPATSAATIEHLYIASGYVCELTNERERAIAIYQAMLGRELDSTATKCIALNLLAQVKPYESMDEDTVLLRHGLPRDKRENEREASVEIAWQLAQLSVERFDILRALQQSERALQVAREQGVPKLVARALCTMASAKMLANEWRDAEGCAEAARKLYEVQQDRLMEAYCLVQVAQAKMNDGYPRDSIIAARAAYAIFTEFGHSWGRSYAAHHLVMVLLDVGIYGEALTLAQETLALARSSNARMLLYLGLSALARVQWMLLDADAAYSLHREILSVFGSSMPTFIEEAVAAALCADCAIAGEWPEAQSYALQALAHRSDSAVLYAGLMRWYETETLLRSGYGERAVVDVEQFGGVVEQSPRYRIPYLRAQAELSLWRCDFADAHDHLQAAMLLAEEAGLPGEQWLIEVARADIYRRQGNKAEAQSAYARAEQIARGLAGSIEDQQVRAKFLAQVQRMVAYA